MAEGKYTKEYKEDKIGLGFKFFNLEVLDRYKNNPIYEFKEYPVSLSIFIKSEYYNDPDINGKDKIDIQSLGYAFRKKDNSRGVVTYLAYLKNLPEEHQNHWASYEEFDDFFLDEEFYNQEIMAEFTERINIFDAFIQEIEEINKICRIEDYPDLFKETYKENKPVKFSWPTKKTSEAYEELIHLFDKFISENINKDFFKNKVKLEEEIREDEKIKIISKATLRLLEEFINKYFILTDTQPKESMIKHFKDIRKKRQHPAHKISKNTYDKVYEKKIDILIKESYRSIRTLRLLFTNFPKARNNYKPPKWLQKGNIA